jgi:hypothetical protein
MGLGSATAPQISWLWTRSWRASRVRHTARWGSCWGIPQGPGKVVLDGALHDDTLVMM